MKSRVKPQSPPRRAKTTAEQGSPRACRCGNSSTGICRCATCTCSADREELAG